MLAFCKWLYARRAEDQCEPKRHVEALVAEMPLDSSSKIAHCGSGALPQQGF